MSSIPTDNTRPVTSPCKPHLSSLDSPLEPMPVAVLPQPATTISDDPHTRHTTSCEMPHLSDDSQPRTNQAEVAQKLSPFLIRHIPEQYNALQSQVQAQPINRTDTKFCYRHHPDLKCRREVNEPTMDLLQNVQ